MKKSPLVLRLKGKTAVFIDWANVYNWKDELKKEVDPKKLLTYLTNLQRNQANKVLLRH